MEKLKELIKSVLPNSYGENGVGKNLAIDDVVELQNEEGESFEVEAEWIFNVHEDGIEITLCGEDGPIESDAEMLEDDIAHCIEAINKKEYHFYEFSY